MSGFLYDTSGNLTKDPNTPTNGIVYDAENHQTSYTKSGPGGGMTTYSYDGDGRRVKKEVPGSPTTTTIFVYNAGGQLIAEYTSDPVPPPQGGGGTSYLTSDHLGSTRVVTSAADVGGNVTVKARYDYLPFGEQIDSDHGSRSLVTGYETSDQTRQKFTQKERDNESGLDYFLARYYSSGQGRFTSPDEFAGGPDELYEFAVAASQNPTFYADLNEPQSLNKYQYAYNNPLLYVDPDGHQQTRLVDPPSKPGEEARLTPIGISVLKVAIWTVVCPPCGAVALLADPPSAGAPTDTYIIESNGNRDIGQQPTVSQATDEAVQVAMIGRVKGSKSGGGAEAGRKPTLSEHKEALREVHNEVGKLPKGEQGKFGSPQRGDSKKGYRLDPGHSRERGNPESGPHINWWDYTKGKKGSGGRHGAVPIPPKPKVRITLF